MPEVEYPFQNQKDLISDEAASDPLNSSVTERLSRNKFVAPVPQFSDQLNEPDRVNEIISSYGRSSRKLKGMKEVEALKELETFLLSAVSKNVAPYSEYAQSILEKAAYIGEKELIEATAGIAEYWKDELRRNPDLCIYTVSNEYFHQISDTSTIGSEEYILERILSHFSDDELERLGGRLTVNDLPPASASLNGNNTRVILVDDWVLSGEQMRERVSDMESHQHLVGLVEIQLVVASSKRIREGLYAQNSARESSYVPVRAYFSAQEAEVADRPFAEAYYMGSHSWPDGLDGSPSVDLIAASIGAELKEKDDLGEVPSLTRIVPPYKYPGARRSEVLFRTARAMERANRDKERKKSMGAKAFRWLGIKL